MKIYILADMEGVSGIHMMEQVKRGHPEHYGPACALMMRDINVAIAAAFDAGFHPWKPELPATVELTLYRSDMADDLAARPGVQRVDARTVRRTVESLDKTCAW